MEELPQIHINRTEELTAAWFKWVAEHPAHARHIHFALYYFLVFYNAQIKWPPKFVFSLEEAKHHLGDAATSTYAGALNDLIEWGFVNLIQRGANQYRPTVISLTLKR